MSKIRKMFNLIKELNEASSKYYNSEESNMSDKEWNNKFDELKELEKETDMILSDSPSVKVGYEIKSNLTKVKHKTALKSLDKTKDIKEIEKFTKGKDCLLMLKDDGLTNEIIFNNGVLQEGSTRGDSIFGEEITHNVKVYKNIPKQIPFKGLLRIVGEAVIKLDDFDKINSKLSEENKYKTSRNLCAGSVRQLDSKICSDRNINFFAFGLLEVEGITFKSKNEVFNWLKELGFEITPHYTLCKKDIEDGKLQDMINGLKKIAIDRFIPIDGLVATYDDIDYSNSLKETEHHPTHSLAFKFFDEFETTQYLYTEWNTTRTGMISATGVFQKCQIDGTDVERATLYNLDIFESLQLGKNDSISVIKANQIIPKIIENETRSNTEKIPCKCPNPKCNSDVEIRIKETARFLYCTNPNCSAKLVKSIEHYASKGATNVFGFSEKAIEQFVDKGIIKSVVDLYKLEEKKAEILKLPKFAITKYNKLIESVEKSKHCKLESFIYGLGIENVGEGTAGDIAKKFKTIHNFINATNSNIMSIEGVGDTTVESILQYRMNNIDLILALLDYIQFDDENKAETASSDKVGIFTGMKIYCTGSFASHKKEELKAIVEMHGGEFANGYAKSLSYLVVGSLKGSSKTDKALKDGVMVLQEEDFLKMIGE